MDTKLNKLKNVNTKTKFSLFDMLYFIIWFGILSGLAEIFLPQLNELRGGRVVFLHFHKVWMSPLVNMIIVGIVGLVILPLLLRMSRSMAVRISFIVLGSVVFLNILVLNFSRLSRIHFAAKVILAIGFSIALQSLIAKWTLGFERFVHRTTIPLVLLVLVLTMIVGGWQYFQYFQEHNLVADLPYPPESAPNVLLIVLDTVRAQSMSLFGYERQTTPFLKNLAKEGVVFQWAIAPCSHTLPTHATLFTGRFQYETGANWSTPLGPTYPTLAEVLRNNGYATAGFVANTRVCTVLSGLARGFNRYEDQITLGGMFFNSSSLIRFALSKNWFRKLINYRDFLGRKRADRITDDFLKWFDSVSVGRPFFAFLNYYDAHQPYLPPGEFDGMFGPTDRLGTYLGKYSHGTPCSPDTTPHEEIQALHNAYDASIAYLDNSLKRLFSELRRRNLIDRTLVILVSDHGEEFGEHSVIGHGTDLHIQSIHVPLLIRYPALVPAGVIVNRPVSLRDVPATAMEILGLTNSFTFPGWSLSRNWSDANGGKLESGEAILSELIYAPWDPEWAPVSKGDMKSIIIGDMHYIRNGDNTEEVYSLSNDPEEYNDLIQTPRGTQMATQARQIIKEIVH